MPNLLWLQGGACSGNTMSFLNAEEPSACDLVTDFGINVLWHPSLGMELGDNLKKLLNALISGEMALDIFVFEGTVVNAPGGTGMWNRFAGKADEGLGRRAAPRSPATPWPSAIARPGAASPRPRRTRRRARACNSSSATTAASSARTTSRRPACPSSTFRAARASRLDHADRRGGRDGTRRRPHARRVPAPEDVLHELHADRLHPQHALRLQGLGDRVRPAQGLPVLRSRLPRPDDAFAVQPHPVEPAIVEDPRRHAVPRLHRAGVSAFRSDAGHACSRRRP